MNFLIDKLPEVVYSGGVAYPIHTDFRVWIRFETLMLQGNALPEQKVITPLTLCYKELPPTLEAAMAALIAFYVGEAPEQTKKKKTRKKPIYSFEHDADYIYSAFSWPVQNRPANNRLTLVDVQGTL